MYCEKCGKQIDDNAMICSGCGCKVVNTDKSDKGINNNDKNITNNGGKSIWLSIGFCAGAVIAVFQIVFFLIGAIVENDFELGDFIQYISYKLELIAVGIFSMCYFGDKDKKYRS